METQGPKSGGFFDQINTQNTRFTKFFFKGKILQDPMSIGYYNKAKLQNTDPQDPTERHKILDPRYHMREIHQYS